MSGGARTVHLEVDEGEVELASDALWAAGASAIQEVDLGGGRVRLEADPRDLSGLAGWAFDVVVLDGDGYLDAWQRFARPVRVGRVVLQPDWVAPVATSADDVVVELAPVRAFGTGSHPSTRTALEALVARVGPATTVLDVGSGTGVLAVAAVLAGAARAVAVDVDPVAVRATAALARRHGVADRLVASGTPVAEVEGTFDLVVANIGAGVLRAMAGDLRARLAPGGHLVLAGVLAGQADEVVAAFEPAVEVERVVAEGWAGLVLSRRPPGGPPGGGRRPGAAGGRAPAARPGRAGPGSRPRSRR